MIEKPKALRLADALMVWEGEAYTLEKEAAAELRRLHEVEGRYFAALVAAAAEREAVCRIVTGLCVSDNNAEEINRAIRARGETK